MSFLNPVHHGLHECVQYHLYLCLRGTGVLSHIFRNLVGHDDITPLRLGYIHGLLVFRKFPAEYNLNIVTNSVSIALEASGNPHYNVILVGGSVNTKDQFTYGHDAVKQLERYHADKLILSVDGIDTSHGFTTYYNKECTVDVTMLKQADTCIVAADRSKFGHSAFTKISDLSVADMIVTSGTLPDEYVDEFKALGVEVLAD